MRGLPDNAGKPRAVAGLTSVGFEGGASPPQSKSWFYTRDDHFNCEISRSSESQLEALHSLRLFAKR